MRLKLFSYSELAGAPVSDVRVNCTGSNVSSSECHMSRDNELIRPGTDQVPPCPPDTGDRAANVNCNKTQNKPTIKIRKPKIFKNRRKPTTTTRKPFTAFKIKPVVNEKQPPVNEIVNHQKKPIDVNKLSPQKDVIEQEKTQTHANNKLQRDSKQLDTAKNIFDEDTEPTPEPEPGSHHGDPRHHAFHSCEYN